MEGCCKEKGREGRNAFRGQRMMGIERKRADVKLWELLTLLSEQGQLLHS